MDLNKAPELYRMELEEEYKRLEEEYEKKKALVNDEHYSAGCGTAFLLGVIAFIVMVIVTNMKYELLWVGLIGVPAVFFVIWLIIYSLQSSAASEKMKQKHKELDEEKEKKRKEKERKCAEYAMQFEREVYRKSVELQKNEVVEEICDLILADAHKRIDIANRSKQYREVTVDFGFLIDQLGFKYSEYDIMHYQTWQIKKYFKDICVKNLPDLAKAEVLARAIADKMKRRLENSYPRDPKCGTPVNVRISRSGRTREIDCDDQEYFASSIRWSVVYTALNNNYVESREL